MQLTGSSRKRSPSITASSHWIQAQKFSRARKSFSIVWDAIFSTTLSRDTMLASSHMDKLFQYALFVEVRLVGVKSCPCAVYRVLRHPASTNFTEDIATFKILSQE
ncbi:hypothetical protein L9F63_015057, partial [Diploptera punctata]